MQQGTPSGLWLPRTPVVCPDERQRVDFAIKGKAAYRCNMHEPAKVAAVCWA